MVPGSPIQAAPKPRAASREPRVGASDSNPRTRSRGPGRRSLARGPERPVLLGVGVGVGWVGGVGPGVGGMNPLRIGSGSTTCTQNGGSLVNGDME